jgi:hypothetical protein
MFSDSRGVIYVIPLDSGPRHSGYLNFSDSRARGTSVCHGAFVSCDSDPAFRLAQVIPSPCDSIRICCAAWTSHGRTKSGPWTSRISRWRGVSSTSPSYSIGRPAGFCRGGCRSRWKRPSASRPWRMPWLVTASRKSSTPTRARTSLAQPSPACSPATVSPSAWMARARGATTYHRTAVAQRRIRGGVSAGLTKASARPAPRTADISISYNGRRPHLDDATPDEAYFNQPPVGLAT